MTEILAKSPAEVSELHSFHPDIVEMALGAYAVLGQMVNFDPETIYWRDLCTGVMLAFYDGLGKMSYEPRTVVRTRGPLQSHRYLDLESDRGLILVDGNWQQYVPPGKRTPFLPRVAVGTADEIVDLAANAGVHEKNLAYWEEKRPPSVQSEYRGRLEPAPDFEDEILAEFGDELVLLAYRMETETY